MSAKISSAQYTVAIVGATGNLGKEVANQFLTNYRLFFPRVIAVGRDISTPEARQLVEQGVELRSVDPANATESFTKAFEGADVVINVSAHAPLEYINALFRGALNNGVKVYFPSEYGSDHRLHNFEGWDAEVWEAKHKHAVEARSLAQGKLKIIALYTGLFMEGTIGPWFGFDTANRVYTCIGSPDKKTAITGKVDIARALAELSLLALSPGTAAQVPDEARIAGDNVSYRDIRDIVQRVRGALGVQPAEIALEEVELAPFREKVRTGELQEPHYGPLHHIRILIAEGRHDFTENNNELVNPGQKAWKWKTVEDYVREVGGKPHC
ncbi:uncharacterized protein FIBRA_07674 [Fibroporia radiculosa]|uniref:NmrA-like domain-containing protein n=1 Tax=Fibroporia radiculosa TaxID=599839 RepID=J4H4R6_9APHY|nr:uncharacterized protein FIBRA_07674 [Fibroporia radiculosa]CCM05454.1 predicted protein [Fibroporia radiculosa]